MLCGGASSIKHHDLQQQMRESVFCPALAGDNAGSGRLTEIILAGCIPVFFLPPAHMTPMPDDFDWAHAAVFFNITRESADWMTPERWAPPLLFASAGSCSAFFVYLFICLFVYLFGRGKGTWADKRRRGGAVAAQLAARSWSIPGLTRLVSRRARHAGLSAAPGGWASR